VPRETRSISSARRATRWTNYSVLLDREHGYLEANDVTSLQGATRERSDACAHLRCVDEERRALCNEMAIRSTSRALRSSSAVRSKGTLTGGWASARPRRTSAVG